MVKWIRLIFSLFLIYLAADIIFLLNNVPESYFYWVLIVVGVLVLAFSFKEKSRNIGGAIAQGSEKNLSGLFRNIV